MYTEGLVQIHAFCMTMAPISVSLTDALYRKLWEHVCGQGTIIKRQLKTCLPKLTLESLFITYQTQLNVPTCHIKSCILAVHRIQMLFYGFVLELFNLWLGLISKVLFVIPGELS